MQIMIDHGYLCPFDTQSTAVNEDPEAFYTFQTEYFYPSHFWDVSDLDYAIHLVRRSSKNSSPLMLNNDEIEQFVAYQKQFETDWKAVVAGAEKQKVYFHSLDKKDKKLLEFRDLSFCRAHKPSVSYSYMRLFLIACLETRLCYSRSTCS